MWSTAREIAAGDTVIIWLTREQVQALVITPGKDLNIKYGYYHHDDLIGVPYGSKVGSRNGKGFIHVLRPTPELWTMALPHRTQILYMADIAFITAHLNVRAGSTVVEAGTGSGSFSHALARTVGPEGHLYTYEFHEPRADKAREEFARHGLANVTLTHRNACKDGFTVADAADAVFLDLPAPWDALEHAKTALRSDRVTRVCCFSPCMEQVLRTVSTLNELGFTDITMYETLLRPYEVTQAPRPPSIQEARDRLRAAEAKREDKRQRQIANAHARGGEGKSKRKREGGDGDDDAEGEKRVRTEADAAVSAMDIDAVLPAAPIPTSSGLGLPVDTERGADGQPSSTASSPAPAASKIPVARHFAEVRGHTSYLTFACLLPHSPSTSAKDGSTPSAKSTPEAAGLHGPILETPLNGEVGTDV